MNKNVQIGVAVLSICLGIGGLFLIAWFAHPAVAAGAFMIIWANNLSDLK